MAENQLATTVQLTSGSLILSAGLAMSAVAAAEKDFTGVFIGFGLFSIGYEISQYGVYTGEQSDLQAFVNDLLESARMKDLFMAVTGIGAISYGFTTLFRSVEEASLFMAVESAVLLFGGYMIAHYAINRTLV